MVDEQEVGTEVQCLVDDLGGRIDRQQDPAYLLVGVAADETDRVPRRGPARVVPLVEVGDELRETHGVSVDGRLRLGRGGRSRDRTCDRWFVRPELYR